MLHVKICTLETPYAATKGGTVWAGPVWYEARDLASTHCLMSAESTGEGGNTQLSALQAFPPT